MNKCYSIKFIGILFLFLFSFFIFSCSKNDPPEPKVEEKDDEFLYAFERYEIVGKKMYAGSEDGAVDRTEQFDPEKYFRTAYFDKSKLEYFKQDSIRAVKDTLIEYPLNYEANTFKFKTGDKDSLFRWNIYAKFWQYYGKFPENKQEISYERYFVRLIKDRKEGMSFYLDERGEGFVDDKSFFYGNIYHFPTSKRMTEATDTLAYCNVRYIYKLVKK
ncbi:hypothetical protein [Sphingobacterium hungaricum]